MLLTTDWHLTDAPSEEYRWQIFATLRAAIKQTKADHVFILGDLTDRKDRHTGELVNRLVREVRALTEICRQVTILRGNHDAPLRGTPYWSFLSNFVGINFVVEPTWEAGGLLLLPHSVNPLEEWAELGLSKARAIFMHQTVNGAVGNNGHVLESDNAPLIPRGPLVYSGDIHVQQTVGRVTYIGAPHPIKFGDNYKLNIFELDDSTFQVKRKLLVKSIAKLAITVSSLEELRAVQTKPRDQVKVCFSLTISAVAQWPAYKQAIIEWAAERQVEVASITTTVQDATRASSASIGKLSILSNAEVLDTFSASEQIDGDMLKTGHAFLKQAERAHA